MNISNPFSGPAMSVQSAVILYSILVITLLTLCNLPRIFIHRRLIHIIHVTIAILTLAVFIYWCVSPK